MQSIFTNDENNNESEEADDFSNEFTRAHKAVIDNTHLFLLNEYGSVNFYLDSIGFDSSWRQRLKRTLMITSPTTTLLLKKANKTNSTLGLNIFYVLQILFY